MKAVFPALTAFGAAVLLAGCSSSRDAFPSLARRDAERITGSMAAPSPATPAAAALPADAGLEPRLAALVAQAEQAGARFAARQASATQRIRAAQGASPGSESWAVANVALADLEAARSEAMIALADLDSLYAAARVENRDAAAISAARERVSALIAGQDAVLAGLR